MIKFFRHTDFHRLSLLGCLRMNTSLESIVPLELSQTNGIIRAFRKGNIEKRNLRFLKIFIVGGWDLLNTYNNSNNIQVILRKYLNKFSTLWFLER
jgi:hypothetical protein